MPETEACTEEWLVSSRVNCLEGKTGRTEQVVLDDGCSPETVVLRVTRTPSSVTSSPSWDTLQIGESSHARFGDKALKLNHAKDPNCRIQISEDCVEIVSQVYIPPDTALTFNYNTTEFSMAEPFTDWATGEIVGGFTAASPDEQQKLIKSGLVSPHVLALFHAQTENSDTT